jgi:hypothetical protein
MLKFLTEYRAYREYRMRMKMKKPLGRSAAARLGHRHYRDALRARACATHGKQALTAHERAILAHDYAKTCAACVRRERAIADAYAAHPLHFHS